MKGVKTLLAAVLVLVVASVPDPGAGQVYRWEDQGGTVHFTNAPDRVPESYRSQVGPLPASGTPGDDWPAASLPGDVAPMPVATGDTSPAPAVPVETAPAGVAREEPVAFRAVTRIPYAPGAPIIVNAKISDSSALVSLILDTGADRTVVAPQTLWRIGISTHNAPRAVIKGVTGSGQAEVIQVSSLQVGDARVGPLRIVAHDADLKQAEGLLGRDFLEHFIVTIDAREQIVTLAPR